MRSTWILLQLTLLAALASPAIAQTVAPPVGSPSAASDVKIVEENGITYRETKRVVKQPVYEVVMEDREQTIYKPTVKQDVQTSFRSYQVPINETVWEPYWEGRYNPFVEPRLAYRQIVRTRWETRTDEVRTPINRTEYVAEKQTVKVPVHRQRLAENFVIERVAVGVKTTPSLAPTGQPTTAVATRPTVGGVSVMKSDPPREGTWHSAGGETVLK